MDVFLSAGLMAAVLVIIVLFLYKLSKMFMKFYMTQNKALKLLMESRDIEFLPTKEQRMVAMVKWKQKRDSVLFSSESIERKLSEVED